MSKSNRTANAIGRLVQDGGVVGCDTAADYRQLQATERWYSDRLRRVSTTDTDPELPHVEYENDMRHEHHKVLMALRQFAPA